MFPEEFIKRISQQKYIDGKELITALGQEPSASIRINRRKWSHPVTSYERVPWEPDGYYLPGRPLFTPDPLFHSGTYYPQEASSMFTGEAFRQVAEGIENIRVLDLCGAPGGKSTHLSSLIPDGGLLISNEVIRSRAAVLAENITKWGIGNAIVTQNDPATFAALSGFFDIMVVDAPCSGEGMFRDPAARSEWSLQNTRLCSERQRRIVMDSWPSLKAGGLLIYSTCTFNPAENEENLTWIRDITGSEPVTLNISIMSGVQPVRYNGIEGYGFYPGRVKGDGFFISALRKRGDRNHERHRFRSNHFRQSAKIVDLSNKLLDVDSDRIAMSGNKIIALAAPPGLVSYVEERLTVIKYGTMIGEMKKDSFIPAHDLAMSVNQRAGAWPVYDASYDDAVSFLRLEQGRLTGMPEGRIMINYRNVPLGFVNNLGRRFNNGYPQAWRMRMERREDFVEIL